MTAELTEAFLGQLRSTIVHLLSEFCFALVIRGECEQEWEFLENDYKEHHIEVLQKCTVQYVLHIRLLKYGLPQGNHFRLPCQSPEENHTLLGQVIVGPNIETNMSAIYLDSTVFLQGYDN